MISPASSMAGELGVGTVELGQRLDEHGIGFLGRRQEELTAKQ